MNSFWSYFWPPFAAGIAIGLVAGLYGWRRRGRSRKQFLALGLVAAIAAAALWHGPLGGAAAFAARIDRNVRKTLVYYQIPEVSGHLHRNPLTRQVMLSGPADDFQRTELVRLMNDLSGVASTTWANRGSRIPLIAEGAIAALLGFLSGLLVAYVVERRRRYNAYWKW